MTDSRVYLETSHGQIIHGDSLRYLSGLPDASIHLIVTSPPFGLLRSKAYGGEPASKYLDWFEPFAREFHRVLRPDGSLVIDIGGSWNRGTPTRSLYHFRLALLLCDVLGFHLAQELYWYNPTKLPTPAEWVTIRRVRVKDAVNVVYWLSPTPWPRVSNRRVLTPYSDSMRHLIQHGYTPGQRPSGHAISSQFQRDNGGAIPPNLITVANTESNGAYLRHCREHDLPVHPARFPAELPEFFVRMLTEEGDAVLDPFAGSCVTGEVCERLGRRWTCVEVLEDYLSGARARFDQPPSPRSPRDPSDPRNYYQVPRPDIFWNGSPSVPLATDGGQSRPTAEQRSFLDELMLQDVRGSDGTE